LSLLTLFSLVSVSAQNDLWYGAHYEDANGLVYEYMRQNAVNTQYEGFFVMSPYFSYYDPNNFNLSGEVVIPDSIPFEISEGIIEYYSVVGIYSLGGLTDITSVVIPDGIKCIAPYAFQGCTGLTSIIIPSSVEIIGERAFEDCTGLESVTFVKGENVHLCIEHSAFAGCTSLKSVYLHSNISAVYNPFVNCSGLESITVDPENKYMDSRNNCNAIIRLVTDYNGNNAKTTLISGCKNTVIPSDVEEIEEDAFRGSSITSLTIPASVSYIKYMAFAECSALESITVDPENRAYDSRDNCNAIIEKTDSISYYGELFRSKDRLILGCKNTSIPSTVTTMQNTAFFGCSGLESIYIPAGVTFIGAGCFYGTGLKSIVVDPDNAVYDSRNGCNAIIDKQDNILYFGCQNTIIPEDVSSIGYYAFAGCAGLGTVLLPEGVRTIYTGAFANCTGLSTVVIPDGVEVIEDRVFENSDIESIIIPKSVRRIGEAYSNSYGAFCRCTNLNSVVFDSESELDTIGAYTFFGCKSLKSIIIPERVTFIGSDAFSNCSNLTSITMLPERSDMISAYNAFSYDCYEKCTVYVPANWYYLYKVRAPWFNFKEIKILEDKDYYTIDGINYKISSVEDKTVSVVYGTYKGDVVIPSTVQINGIDYSVKEIGREAFVENKQLTSVTLPEGVTSIGDYAFSECDSLTSVIIPNSIQDIGLAFYNCSGIKNISLPSSISSIIDKAFYCCSNLVSIDIPESVMSIGRYAFHYCSNLASINIPESVTSIGEYAFYNCKSLSSVVIPDGVTSINSGVFYGCNALSYLYIPSSVDSFGRDAFTYCFKLQSAGPKGGGYNIEFSWDTIPGCAFNGMRSLKSIYIPKSVKLIDSNGVRFMYVNYTDLGGSTKSCFKTCYFENCDSLESLAISFSDTKIMRRISPYSRYIFESPADFSLYIGTPIHSITILDDTIKTMVSMGVGMIDEFVVSEYVKEIYPGAFCQIRDINNIGVEKGNSNYSSVDGVLFNKDRSELLAYPTARKGEYVVPATVSSIAALSFKGCKGLSSVIIPSNVEWIGESAFEGCDSLKEVTINGLPEIALDAFANSNNIESVWTRSSVPGVMDTYDTPHAIVAGDYSNIKCGSGLELNTMYNYDLGRIVSEINPIGILSWTCDITLPEIPEGSYNIYMGILPNINQLPNYIHPVIYGITDNDEQVVLLDSVEITKIEYRPGKFLEVAAPNYIISDISKYDTLMIADTLKIPSGFKQIIIGLECGVNEENAYTYSSNLLLDRIFLEPLDNDAPAETYAGTFTANVFNNATLYVPEEAADVYRVADGWKLFKNIAIDTAVETILQDSRKSVGSNVIYDINGRKIPADSLKGLQPGLYIIDGKKYLKR